VCAFAAAESHVSSEDHFAGEKEGEAAAEALMKIREVEVATGEGDFAGIIKSKQADGADDAAVVFGLDEKRVWGAETEITEGT